MSQNPYDQPPPQQYPSGPYQGQYPQQTPPTAYGPPGYGQGQPGYSDPSQQQQAYQPYPQNPGYQDPYNPYASPIAQPTQGGGGLAITGMVLGIVSIALFWFVYLGIPAAIVGLILSIIARRSPVRRGMSLAGIICSAIGLVLAIVYIIIIGIIVAHYIQTAPTY